MPPPPPGAPAPPEVPSRPPETGFRALPPVEAKLGPAQPRSRLYAKDTNWVVASAAPHTAILRGEYGTAFLDGGRLSYRDVNERSFFMDSGLVVVLRDDCKPGVLHVPCIALMDPKSRRTVATLPGTDARALDAETLYYRNGDKGMTYHVPSATSTPLGAPLPGLACGAFVNHYGHLESSAQSFCKTGVVSSVAAIDPTRKSVFVVDRRYRDDRRLRQVSVATGESRTLFESTPQVSSWTCGHRPPIVTFQFDASPATTRMCVQIRTETFAPTSASSCDQLSHAEVDLYCASNRPSDGWATAPAFEKVASAGKRIVMVGFADEEHLVWGRTLVDFAARTTRTVAVPVSGAGYLLPMRGARKMVLVGTSPPLFVDLDTGVATPIGHRSGEHDTATLVPGHEDRILLSEDNADNIPGAVAQAERGRAFYWIEGL